MTRLLMLSGFAALILAGCDAQRGVGPLQPQTMTGVWSGRTLPALGAPASQIGAAADSLRLDLHEDSDGHLSGSAVVAVDGDFRVFGAAGQNQFPRVVLTLDPGVASGAELIQVEGQFVSAASVEVRIVGDGFVGDRAVLQRRQTVIF